MLRYYSSYAIAGSYEIIVAIIITAARIQVLKRSKIASAGSWILCEGTWLLSTIEVTYIIYEC
jgi:hypothetical protein